MIEIQRITNEEQLEDLLSTPYPEDIEAARELGGDVLILGAGGKMGPTLTARILRAMRAAGVKSKTYAASRFSEASQKERLQSLGVHAISADLVDEPVLDSLPDCPNVIYMAGMKFGTTGQEDLTWVMNAYLPGRIADRFRNSRIVAFSTGNVYPFVPIGSGGSRETDRVGPVGEYAQSCLGRERVLSYFSRQNETPMCILRLNYAVEPRYGVLLDIATSVYAGEALSVETGYVNVIWQGDASSICFRSFGLCRTPAAILNVTGPEILSVKALAEEFARRFGRPAILHGVERDTALLSNADRCRERFGPPRVTVNEVIDLTAHWVELGGLTLGKPTKFEVRDGKF